MKKLLIIFTLIVSLFLGGGIVNNSFAADCDFDFNEQGEATKTIGGALDDCFKDSNVVQTEGGLAIGGESDGFKSTIQGWISLLGGMLAILAVGSIVYGSFLLVISQGEEEKLKKGKDVVKWGILGFLGVVFAGALITIVVNIMFSI